MAIPVGTQVLGRVASIEPLSHKRRALAIANGDFTPLRKAHVDFDMLVLKDGTRLPLHTSVSEGVPNPLASRAGQIMRGPKTPFRDVAGSAAWARSPDGAANDISVNASFSASLSLDR
jgi:hypothetical protein